MNDTLEAAYLIILIWIKIILLAALPVEEFKIILYHNLFFEGNDPSKFLKKNGE